MSAANLLGLLLGIAGAFGMWLAGRDSYKGWAVGLAIQPVWVVFFVVVGSYTGLLAPLLYGSVYARNLWKWRLHTVQAADL